VDLQPPRPPPAAGKDVHDLAAEGDLADLVHALVDGVARAAAKGAERVEVDRLAHAQAEGLHRLGRRQALERRLGVVRRRTGPRRAARRRSALIRRPIASAEGEAAS
jgi:hypothetical protein